MEAPVNLTNLRSMTDGDKQMEQELFKEFFIAFDAGIHLLQASTSDSFADTWRRQAHALKGIALNLGAERLGTLCKQAQDLCNDPPAAKTELLGHIQAEYDDAKNFLQKVMAA